MEEHLEEQNRRILCRRLSRIGWGVLLYFVAAQLGAGLLLLIPAVSESLALTLVVSYALNYGIAPLALWLVIRSLPRGESPGLTLSPKAFIRTAAYSMGVLYLFSMVTSLLMLAVETLSGQSTGDLLQSVADTMPTWAFVLLSGVLAPIFEELIFRGLLLSRLRPFGDRCAIWVSGVAFGLFHMNLYQFFYATALGLVFAGVVLKTGKLRHTIALHAIVNLSSVAVSQLSGLEAGDGDLVNMGLSLIVLALIAFSIYCFVRYARAFRHAPPTYPVTERQALLALPRSAGIWVCALVSMAASVAVIFVV